MISMKEIQISTDGKVSNHDVCENGVRSVLFARLIT